MGKTERNPAIFAQGVVPHPASSSPGVKSVKLTSIDNIFRFSRICVTTAAAVTEEEDSVIARYL